MPLPTLSTERLLLRPLHDTDAEYIAVLAGEWEVASNTRRIPHPYNLELAQQFIRWQAQAQQTRQEDIFAVCRTDQQDLIGCMSLRYDAEQTELGYWFGQAFWGCGYATEAARAVLEYGAVTQGKTHIYAEHLLSNPQSGRVLAKLGFQAKGSHLGTGRDGEAVELVAYELHLLAAHGAADASRGFV